VSEWITLDHFLAVLERHGFEIRRESDDHIIIAHSSGDRTPYKPRSDGRVPPKTFKRFAYKYGFDVDEFFGPSFQR